MGSISFTDATEVLRSFLFSKGRADHTVKAYLTDLKMFWQEMDLETIDLPELEILGATWLNTRRRVMSPKTTGRRLTTIKNLGLAYKVAILTEYTPPTPATPKPHPLPGGTADLKSLIDGCYLDEHKALVTLTGLCGARVSEARDVTPDDFNLEKRTVEIWGKGDKVRIIPLSDMAWEILLPIIVDRMTTDRCTQPLISMGDRTARELITTLGRRAGISRPISSHDLRATFATAAYNVSKDIRAVQLLLGHASSKQTELYIGVADDQMRTAANFMGV
jgi:site-specific recombinase XerD